MKGKAERLRNKLDEVIDYYDYVIIDCPPSIGLLTTNALMASRWVIIPVDTGFYSLVGIKQFLARIEDVRATNRELEIMGILLTLFTERSILGRDVREKLVDSFGSKVFGTPIRKDVKLAEAPGHLMSVFEYMWNGRGATDYLALAREVDSMNKAARTAV